ncbi:hypothetical protein BT96DRAFT_701904 [Gymnopus androsaceus JB14]|uniref:Uncharacterized protein n=1 Tax=Gymnopus androsaceus JB14 TaxID=1447944 RepID=A0A6A4HQB5_9AGAR|nr:hypothetical protein BT96DRAFT_701904 [Gymnopus androsaceus JB14]
MQCSLLFVNGVGASHLHPANSWSEKSQSGHRRQVSIILMDPSFPSIFFLFAVERCTQRVFSSAQFFRFLRSRLYTLIVFNSLSATIVCAVFLRSFFSFFTGNSYLCILNLHRRHCSQAIRRCFQDRNLQVTLKLSYFVIVLSSSIHPALSTLTLFFSVAPQIPSLVLI